MRPTKTFCLMALAALPLLAGAAQINHAYRITGDAGVAPAQAFDDGQKLYLQLRDPRRPPVPFSRDNQPLQYEIKFPYMVIDLNGVMDKTILRYGYREALIESALKRSDGAAQKTIPGTNVYYSGASPAKVGGDASPPIPAQDAANRAAAAAELARKQQVATPTASTAATSKPEVVPAQLATPKPELSGKDGKAEASSAPAAAPKSRFVVERVEVPSVEREMRVAAKLTPEARSRVDNLIAAGVTAILSDNSVAGYRYARQIADRIEKQTGARPAIETNGAPAGYVLVKG